jgi:hypothetical protein
VSHGLRQSHTLAHGLRPIIIAPSSCVVAGSTRRAVDKSRGLEKLLVLRLDTTIVVRACGLGGCVAHSFLPSDRCRVALTWLCGGARTSLRKCIGRCEMRRINRRAGWAA